MSSCEPSDGLQRDHGFGTGSRRTRTGKPRSSQCPSSSRRHLYVRHSADTSPLPSPPRQRVVGDPQRGDCEKPIGISRGRADRGDPRRRCGTSGVIIVYELGRGTRKSGDRGRGLGRSRTAEQLRRAGHSGEVVIVSDEVHLPYDRPPLSKEVLREDDPAFAMSRSSRASSTTRRASHCCWGSAATAVDTAARTVHAGRGAPSATTNSSSPPVWCPDASRRSRIWPASTCCGPTTRVRSLRSSAGVGAPAVVVGAGFIGCEVAASLRALGVDVVLVEPQPQPLASVLGAQIGALVDPAAPRRRRRRAHRCRRVAEVRGDRLRRVRQVVLSDGCRSRRRPGGGRHRLASGHRLAGRQRHCDGRQTAA